MESLVYLKGQSNSADSRAISMELAGQWFLKKSVSVQHALRTLDQMPSKEIEAKDKRLSKSLEAVLYIFTSSISGVF